MDKESIYRRRKAFECNTAAEGENTSTKKRLPSSCFSEQVQWKHDQLRVFQLVIHNTLVFAPSLRYVRHARAALATCVRCVLALVWLSGMRVAS